MAAIQRDLPRTMNDLETRKKRREEDLAQQKKEADEAFADFVLRETAKADAAIEQANVKPTKQVEANQKALDRAQAAYEANLAKQEKSFDKAQSAGSKPRQKSGSVQSIRESAARSGPDHGRISWTSKARSTSI